MQTNVLSFRIDLPLGSNAFTPTKGSLSLRKQASEAAKPRTFLNTYSEIKMCVYVSKVITSLSILLFLFRY